nr:MAG TPA: hypothetical protein [Caudoviricetes sp.]
MGFSPGILMLLSVLVSVLIFVFLLVGERFDEVESGERGDENCGECVHGFYHLVAFAGVGRLSDFMFNDEKMLDDSVCDSPDDGKDG